VTPTDWENDPRQFADALHVWASVHGWSDAELARQLRQPYYTVRVWLPRPAPRHVPKLAPLIRRLMTEIDRNTHDTHHRD
jgi:hypothetical protein